MSYVYRTERMLGSYDGVEKEYIVQLIADENGELSDPRDADNFTLIYGDHRHYTIGNGKPPSEHQYILDRGGIRLLWRYMRLFGDPANEHSKVLAFTKLGMIDHSGISYYTVEMGSSAEHWADPGGWDSGAVGYVYITQKQWDLIGGGDPYEAVDSEVKFPLGNVPVQKQRVWHMLEVEVDTYDDWARGNVWGLVATEPCDHADEHGSDESRADCPHAPTAESIWGYVGDPDDAWRDLASDMGLHEAVVA